MKWIDIKDDQPKEYRSVLFSDGEEIWLGYINGAGAVREEWFGCTNDKCTYIDDVCGCAITYIPTHWMWLPELPTKELL